MHSVNNHRDCINKICQNWLKSHQTDATNITDFEQYAKILVISQDISQLIQKAEAVIQDDRIQKQEISRAVFTVLSDCLEIEAEELVPSANWTQDLKIDSLEWQELLVALEKTFCIKISHEVASTLVTLQEFIGYIVMIVQEKNKLKSITT